MRDLLELPIFLRHKNVLLCIALILITIGAFYKVHSFSFLSYDDEQYISQNPYLEEGLTLESLSWAFTSGLSQNNPHTDYWQPLTFVSRLIDIELFGLNPAGHHLMNLWFHIVNTLLVFGLFLTATKSPIKSFFIACLFAIHPTQAEAVAWATARKDLLSGLLTLLSLAAYTQFTIKQKNSRPFFITAIFLYFCAMLSKPVAMFPVYLLIWDFWPLQRYAFPASFKDLFKLFIEKIPFFVLSLLGFIAMFAPAMAPSEAAKPYLPTALLSYIHYLQSYIYPINMGLHGPELPSLPALWKLLSCFALLLGIFHFCARHFKSFPFLTAGWLWFFCGLIPLAGGEWVCDRFLYLPMLGLSVITVFGTSNFLESHPNWKKEIYGLIAIVFFLLISLTFYQLDFWKDNRSFFKRASELNPKNYIALNNYGVLLGLEGKSIESRDYFHKSFTLNPKYQEASINMGVASIQLGRIKDAFYYYQHALKINPKVPMVHCNLGSLYLTMGRFEEAAREFQAALKLDPHFPEAKILLEIAEKQLNHPADGPR